MRRSSITCLYHNFLLLCYKSTSRVIQPIVRVRRLEPIKVHRVRFIRHCRCNIVSITDSLRHRQEDNTPIAKPSLILLYVSVPLGRETLHPESGWIERYICRGAMFEDLGTAQWWRIQYTHGLLMHNNPCANTEDTERFTNSSRAKSWCYLMEVFVFSFSKYFREIMLHLCQLNIFYMVHSILDTKCDVTL